MEKRTYRFLITKNPERQGAWLLLWDRELLYGHQSEDRHGITLEDIESSSGASAWTTLAAAKRAAARMLDRHRLPWEEADDMHRAVVQHREY
jgi:hypothetical protein